MFSLHNLLELDSRFRGNERRVGGELMFKFVFGITR